MMSSSKTSEVILICFEFLQIWHLSRTPNFKLKSIRWRLKSIKNIQKPTTKTLYVSKQKIIILSNNFWDGKSLYRESNYSHCEFHRNVFFCLKTVNQPLALKYYIRRVLGISEWSEWWAHEFDIFFEKTSLHSNLYQIRYQRIPLHFGESLESKSHTYCGLQVHGSNARAQKDPLSPFTSNK